MYLLEANNLSFSFHERPLFRGVSFALQGGQVLHVRGANGVGKSTLLKVASGLWQQTGGEVILRHRGHAVANPHVEYLAAESNGLYTQLSAAANLGFWTGLRGGAPEGGAPRFDATLTHWGLQNEYTAHILPVGRFSTGMKRRLGLARLFSSPAPIYVMDEPGFGLDAEGCSLFRDALIQFKERGGIALVVSHDRLFVDGLADQEIVLSGGSP